jgi:hypothetical protein
VNTPAIPNFGHAIFNKRNSQNRFTGEPREQYFIENWLLEKRPSVDLRALKLVPLGFPKNNCSKLGSQ